MPQSWFLYMIENRLGHYYTGICKDINRRFAEHQANGSKTARALRGKGPLKLALCLCLPTQSDALRAEREIKRLSRQRKQALIRGQYTPAFSHQRMDLTSTKPPTLSR